MDGIFLLFLAVVDHLQAKKLLLNPTPHWIEKSMIFFNSFLDLNILNNNGNIETTTTGDMVGEEEEQEEQEGCVELHVVWLDLHPNSITAMV